jgi:hypothetical protein
MIFLLKTIHNALVTMLNITNLRQSFKNTDQLPLYNHCNNFFYHMHSEAREKTFSNFFLHACSVIDVHTLPQKNTMRLTRPNITFYAHLTSNSTIYKLCLEALLPVLTALKEFFKGTGYFPRNKPWRTALNELQ